MSSAWAMAVQESRERFTQRVSAAVAAAAGWGGRSPGVAGEAEGDAGIAADWAEPQGHPDSRG